MGLVNLKEALTYSKEGGALGAFNVSSWEMAPAIISAAEKLNTPVVLQSQWPFLHYAGLKRATNFLVDIAENSQVPVALQLDHARSWDQIMLCLRAGFSSIMIDASHLPFEENIRLVTSVVNVAHSMGVTVESELGRLSGREDEIVVNEADAMLTDPEEAAIFIDQTKIDALAISIGTVHGDFKGDLNIDFDRLNTIQSQSNIPLVLHGASGVPSEILQQTVRLGIRKVNFSTELREAWLSSLRDNLNKGENDPIYCSQAAENSVESIVSSKIKTLLNIPE